MSLYYEAATLIPSNEDKTELGSLKTRVFASKNLKSSPLQVFALLTEASKWSPILKEVIERSQLLDLERKLSPSLALLLVHDLLLTKNGVAATASHPLKLAVTRHKARLQAELTKARLKRGFSSLENLRKSMSDVSGARHSLQKEIETMQKVNGPLSTSVSFHPRWVRINTLRTTTKEQLQSTFSEYEIMSSLEELRRRSQKSADEKCLVIDEHIPDLLALPANSNLQKTSAYLSGMIILQDKASCFPAYILGSCSGDGDLIDACAAPGNKATHLAAILQDRCGLKTRPKILACERDKDRAATLQTMIDKAAAQALIIARPGQDFLKTKPQERPWNSAQSFLLDPSCSGSGMTGRDENFRIFLPQHKPDHASNPRPQKRKRVAKLKHDSATDETKEETPALDGGHDVRLSSRLEALSTFQLRLLLHAFKFPRARNVVYSTCSIYAEENEHVVLKALDSAIAQERHWRIRKRKEQVSGAKTWAIRGDPTVCHEHFSQRNQYSANEIAESCIRCEKNTSEGTQGFFVAAFVRDDSDDDHLVEKSNAFDPVINLSSHANGAEFNHEWDDIEEEWEGFNDETANSDRISESI